MAQEIGTAYVTVQPSGQGFSKSIEGQVGDGMAGAEKKASSGLWGLTKKVGKWAVGAVAVAGAAVTGRASETQGFGA